MSFLPGLGPPPDETWVEPCPKCGAPARCRFRPDTVHFAELRCSAYPQHFLWLPKPRTEPTPEPETDPNHEDPTMAKISEEFASKYLSAADLGEFKGRKTVLTIESASIETFKNDDGQKVKKVVLQFRDHDKAMVVNATNRDVLVNLYGDDTDDWEGQLIGLHVERVQFGAKRVDAIRLDEEKPRPSKKSEKAPAKAAAKPERDAGEDEGEEDDDEPVF